LEVAAVLAEDVVEKCGRRVIIRVVALVPRREAPLW
jgi:hypothetical protein